jgi:hypothetical protein
MLASRTGVANDKGESLEAMAFLLGHCWRGTFPGGKAVDTHCYERVFGQFIRDRHIVPRAGADYCGETIYWREPDSHAVSYLYFNSDGGTSRGTMEVAGARLEFGDEEYTGPDGRKQKFRTSWQREVSGAYLAVTEEQKDGKWKEAWRIRFERTTPEVAAQVARSVAACASAMKQEATSRNQGA